MVYADNVAMYLASGWTGVLPTDSRKVLQVSGVTGWDGIDPTPAQINEYVRKHGDQNIAIRMPWGVVGIDVDAYFKAGKRKQGDRTLAALEATLGELPATWESTSRPIPGEGEGKSGKRFYKVPDGRYRTILKSPDGSTGDIEVLQFGHRYAVVPPSVNQDSGAQEQWFTPDGQPSDTPPSPQQLTELPLAWVKHLEQGASTFDVKAGPTSKGYQFLAQLQADDRDPCKYLAGLQENAAAAIRDSDTGSRHDNSLPKVLALVFSAADGHPGAGTVLEELREAWAEATAGEDREDEFERMVLGAARKAVTYLDGRIEPNSHDSTPDGVVCEMVEELSERLEGDEGDREDEDMDWSEEVEDADDSPAFSLEDLQAMCGQVDEVPPDSPAAERGPVPTQTYAKRMFEVIGVEQFMPSRKDELAVAEDAASRLSKAIRLQNTGEWLERGAEKWVPAPKGVGRRALAQLGKLVPSGEDWKDLRAKMRTGKTLASVAGLMEDLSGGRGEPLFLDSEDTLGHPYHIWSGGKCIDISKSQDKLVYVEDTEGIVNVHTTRYVADETCPTPLFDAFCEAVWPDPEVRAFALRVLSVGFTGEPAAILPVLHGNTGSGKTSMAETLLQVLGDYGCILNKKVLYSDDNSHGTFKMVLKGARLAYVDESPVQGKVDPESLKQFTGGSKITGNKMRQDAESFSATHTMVMSSNPEPNLKDPALVRRIRIIPCATPKELVKPARAALGSYTTPHAAIHNEGPGILAKMIKEAARWLMDRESADMERAPESLQENMERIRENQDTVAQFLADSTDPASESEGTAKVELYRAYVAWEEYRMTEKKYILGRNSFYERMGEKGLIERRVGNQRLFPVALNRSIQ